VYRLVLPSLPADKRPRAIESLMSGLALAGDNGACAQAALELAPAMPRGPSFANAISFALGCVTELKGAEGEQARKVLLPLGEEALRLPGLLADDRSGLYEELVALRQQAGDAAGAKDMASRWLTFLEAEASRAPTPEQRAAFDPHRVNAALALGEPLRAEAALKASEHDLPRDYNPPARLAIIYDAAGRTGDALAAIGRALRKVYGPRALRLYDFAAELQLKKGDKRAARAMLHKALAAASALPASAPGRAARIESLHKRLASIH
jgi:tetratricopeptide (TPR) repeat protein